MNIWRGGDSTKGTRGADVLRHFARERLVRSYFSLLFFEIKRRPLVPFQRFTGHKKGTPERFIFVDSPRKERLPLFLPLSPFPKKKERNRSLGSLFIEITFRYYESRNARETLRETLVRIYMYMKICAALFSSFSLLVLFPSLSPLYQSHFLIIHFAQRHVTTAAHSPYNVTNY